MPMVSELFSFFPPSLPSTGFWVSFLVATVGSSRQLRRNGEKRRANTARMGYFSTDMNEKQVRNVYLSMANNALQYTNADDTTT
jgi:hypothetical protein